MATKAGSEIQELTTQVALLTQEVKNLSAIVEKSVGDHEGRIRGLESGHNIIKTELEVVRSRMTIFNLLQVTLTGVMSTLAYWLAGKK